MPAHLVFISLFLGLVSGKQMVELHADPAVTSIRILLANQEIARLTQPPWRQEIDLGPELTPRELTAIAYDDKGEEIGRASQILNLPRPPAEIEFVRQGDAIQMRWSSLQYKPPRKATVTLDGKRIPVDRDFRVQLPKSDDARPHVIVAEMRFDDDVVARREAVIEGNVFSDTEETQLTPVVVRETSPRHPPALDGCFSIDGDPVRVAAVEKETAHVVFVKDPDPSDVVRAIDPAGRAWNPVTRYQIERVVALDNDTSEEIVWPYTKAYFDASRHSVAHLLDRTSEAKRGLVALLTTASPSGLGLKTRYSDAVASAGLRALSGGRRRAVVFVLNEREDASRFDPRAVRRYLETIGVPFFVWSATEPSRGAVDRWGPVEDISNLDHLRDATAKLRDTLASQRVAWVHASALDALRIKVDETCGFAR
ncbi:MAG TPA: hypothetical protein VI391_06670 [Thermoanaerobaculia bacterium]